MQILTAEEMRTVDRVTVERFGVSSLEYDGKCRAGSRPIRPARVSLIAIA